MVLRNWDYILVSFFFLFFYVGLDWFCLWWRCWSSWMVFHFFSRVISLLPSYPFSSPSDFLSKTNPPRRHRNPRTAWIPIQTIAAGGGRREAKGGAAGAGLDDDVLGLIVFKADVSDPDGRIATWREDVKQPCPWDGVALVAEYYFIRRHWEGVVLWFAASVIV